MRRVFLGLVTLSLVTTLSFTTGCSVPGFGPKPEDTLDDLARALTTRDLAKADFSGTTAAKAQKEFDRIIGGVKDLKSSVNPGEVKTHDNDASAELTWSWDVGSDTWTYKSRVALHKSGKAWRVAWRPSIVEPSLEAGETLQRSTLKAKRGDITGAGGRALVTPRPVLRVGLDKSQLTADQVVGSARSIAALVDIKPGPYLKQVRAAGPKAFVEALVLRRDEVPGTVLSGYPDIPGGAAIADHLPLAPTKDFAAAVLGTVGPATAEIVKDSDGRVKAGDDVGLSGLQKRYDEQLAGKRGARIVAVDKEGKRRRLFEAKPADGKSLSITLDPGLQQSAQDALADVGSASALVAIKPSTGELLAVASGPGSKGINTATEGRYAPGSTFKVVTALALLRSGLAPSSKVSCTPRISVNGKSFKNYSDYPSDRLGRITLQTALANSCNTGFISQHEKLKPGFLERAAASLGLGVDHDLGFPAYFGQVPAASGETELAADMIGQGKVLASPMAMAAVAASVVRGKTVVPKLLAAESGSESSAPTESTLTDEETARLRTMMRAVVVDGSGSFLKDLSGPPVLAKTGTAEYGDKPPLPTHAWMIGAQGDLAVAVFVDKGESGSGTAGPVLQDFLESAG